MTKAATFVLFLIVTVSTCSIAQSSGGPCPTFNADKNPISTPSKDLICIVPQVYGPSGLVGTNDFGPLVNTSGSPTSHDVDFRNSTFVTLPALTSEIGTQLSQLPLTSPVSGFIFSFSGSLGVFTEVTQNFGPILSERAQTIGRHRLFVGVSYQYFNFDEIDGVNLRNFGAAFRHETSGLSCTPGTVGCTSDGLFIFAKDVITTQNSLDLKIHEIAAVATFGFTDRLDVSVAVPILNVREGMYSTATIHSFENAPFDTSADANFCGKDPLSPLVQGCMHQFSTPAQVPGETLLPAQPYPVLQNSARFFKASSASGIGDVIFRGKFQAIKGEKIGLAVGVDVHAPTGDELNLLGSGTWGTRPFVAVSHAGRVAPHGSFGYQINGNSVLAGDITQNTKAHLPNVVSYDAGADFGVTRRISVSSDFIGLALLNETKITETTFKDFGGGTHPDIIATKETSNQLSVAIGGKVKPFGRLLITANVLIRANDAGLHAKPAPLVGLSYTF